MNAVLASRLRGWRRIPAGWVEVFTREDARDRHARELLALPLVRASILFPAVAAVLYGGAVGTIADARVFAVAVSVAVLLGAVAALRPWPSEPGQEERARRMEAAWQLLCSLVGIAMISPFLVLAVEVRVVLFAPVFAVIMVTAVFSLPWRWRVPVGSWIVVVWGVTLLWSGVRDLPTLVAQLGGAVLVLVATVRISTVLSDNLVEADHLRVVEERRERLLASLLRTNSLEPDDVLRAVVDGLMEVGFDLAAIRTLDHDRRTAELVEGAARTDLALPQELPFEGTLFPQVVATRAAVQVRDATNHPDVLDIIKPMDGLVLLPLVDRGVVRAVITAGMLDRPIDDASRTAAELLAEQAGAALARARAFTADRHTAAELRRLDLRTKDFVSTVSHELRTPLTVVQGLGQTLQSRWSDLPAENRADLLSRVDANADRLAAMVRSLLDTSAVESGDLDPHLEVVRVRDTVQELLHRVVSVTDSHPIEVDVPADLHADVDPHLLGHVIENLLTNVAKHTPRGTHARLQATRRGDRVEIVVTDEGPGIDPDDLPHVLDRFYRGGEPNRRSSSGLGLGLALAREVVRAHGGRLEVASEPGRGTRFSFDVPVADPTADRAGPPVG